MARLQFKGKQLVQNFHHTVPYRQLIPRAEQSLTDKASPHDNLIIHGDNLAALKALLPNYAGRVKCIYIDPPYNTGNENWAYNDNVNSPMMQEWLGKTVDREDLTRHDKWLCMMTPRLKLLRELLADDGVIFTSIDDNEVHHLRSIMDEIFGEYNFSTQFVWEKKKKPSFLHKNVGSISEYIICYLKDSSKTFPFSIEKTTAGKKYPLNNAGNAVSILEFPAASVKFGLDDQIIKAKDMSEGRIITKLVDDVVVKDSTNQNKFRLEGEWRYSQEKLNEIISTGDSIVISQDPFRPNHVKSGGEIKKMKNMVTPHHYDTPTNEDATDELSGIFGGNSPFENPKPSGLIKRLVKAVTYNDKEAIILDSFAGSGTTAHAVLDLNKEDGGNRKFILVEMEDYANDITAERVRRVINGVPDAKGEKLQKGLGGSFSYFDLGEPIELQSILEGENLPTFQELARYVFYTATGEEFNENAIDEETHFVGESDEHQVYLFYKPDLEYLKNTALTLEKAKALGPIKDGRRRLVFAPTKYLDQSFLDEYRIDFAQLPFEIYQLAE